jgi:hypothetical protein
LEVGGAIAFCRADKRDTGGKGDAGLAALLTDDELQRDDARARTTELPCDARLQRRSTTHNEAETKSDDCDGDHELRSTAGRGAGDAGLAARWRRRLGKDMAGWTGRGEALLRS